MIPILKTIAKESSSDYAPALTLGSALDVDGCEWLELLISRAFTTFASRHEMNLCKPLLCQITQQEWSNVAPTVVLKLRANPEKSLETTLALVEGLRDVDIGDPQFLETLLKQLKSSKTHIRALAKSILVRMALLKPRSPIIVNIAEAIANALTSSLTQADQRQTAYEALRDMCSDGQLSVETNVVSTVLTSICTALGKEAKTATSAREAALEALLQWVAVAKRNDGGDKGYEEALEFLRKPLLDGSGPDTLWRCGKFLTFVYPDVVESVVLDLWTTKLEKGLQLLVDASTKKHSASSTVPPVEGLIAVNLALIYAFASGSLDVTPGINKVLSAGLASDSKTSFLYSNSMTDAVVTNAVVGQLLPRTIALYTKLLAKKEEALSAPYIGIVSQQQVTSAARALAFCVAHPSATPDMDPSKAILSCVKTVLTYQPSAADALLEALLVHTNALTLANEEMIKSMNASREAREAFSPAEQPSRLNIKGQGSVTASHMGFDSYAVRCVASKLATSATNPTSLATALLLMHVGSFHRRRGGRLCLALNSRTFEIINEKVLPWIDSGDESVVRSRFADFISTYACNYRPPETQYPDAATESGRQSDVIISAGLCKSALSLVSSMGMIASTFDPEINDPEDEDMKLYVFAQKLCTKDVASRFAIALRISLAKLETFSEDDIDLYKSPMGLPFHGNNGGEENSSEPGKMKISGGRNKRGKGGASFEDEEWEQQMRKELAQKASSVASDKSRTSRSNLSPEDKELAERQDQERRRMALVLDIEFSRGLSAIQSLCLSDIEVGNASLPALSEVVVKTAISCCAAFQGIPSLVKRSLETLTVLAMCVYEIDEQYAPSMAQALIISCRRGVTGSEGSKEGQSFVISALPSPCEAAACTIFEMDELHDRLSGASFSFLFPVLRAALTGPRTTPGCEGALRVLERHTPLLAGDEMDPVVASMRKDMVTTVLELLAHDRSQTFLDPTPYDAIVSCYYTDDDVSDSRPALSAAEIAPLLNEHGALGAKNSRVGSMLALGAIASKHQKLCKNNPLIESRIWLNCFDDNERIRDTARSTWRIVTGGESGEEDIKPPSPMYGISLLPLLHHADTSVAKSAAQAYAHAMGKHPSSTERNMEKLCSNFIDNYPATGDDGKQKSTIPLPLNNKKAIALPPAKSPSISTGLPKKKTVKKTTALSVAGIGKPKITKKKVTNSALLRPKEERTFDRELLEGQFRTEKHASEEEKDSLKKIEVRHGVLRTIAACTDSSHDVKFDISTLKLVTGFLIVYGLADGNDDVRGEARNALRDVVASSGDSEEAVAFLLPLFEAVLNTGDADESCLGPLSTEKVPRNAVASDRRKEGVIVALGSVALHLKGAENETKIDSTIDMLISALKTPSEDVQSSIALCLAKLMKKGRTQERAEEILSSLMSECLNGDSPAIRRGAAYGISAVVKGSGIATLKKYELVKKLEEACACGSSNAKEGALFAIELLSNRLGLLFEPYVIVLLPSLLKAFSDSSDYVRLAASKTADVIMSNLSAHGVKLVMPAVLTAFNDPSWRTKQASIHMLGSMSHCAPKQLASALPKVVPKVIDAFSDTHPKVKASAEEALNEISKVVKNPEISTISPILLKALTDPAEYTIRGLEALISTEFLHAIDAPSLALIVPVLHRGLRDRGAATKRYGALISGNICTMINDPKDFVPYISILIPDLKSALRDLSECTVVLDESTQYTRTTLS